MALNSSELTTAGVVLRKLRSTLALTSTQIIAEQREHHLVDDSDGLRSEDFDDMILHVAKELGVEL